MTWHRWWGRPEIVSGGTASPAAGALRSARTITDDGTPSQPLPVLAQPLVPQARRADPFDHSAAVTALFAEPQPRSWFITP